VTCIRNASELSFKAAAFCFDFVVFHDQLATGCVFLLQLCGLAILIAGALTYANIDKVDYYMDKVNNEVNVSASPIALIVVGSIVFVIAFYGCCGAIRESHCMIVTVRRTSAQ
jgi:uncharacterized membrane protein YidH (DUF202 family)